MYSLCKKCLHSYNDSVSEFFLQIKYLSYTTEAILPILDHSCS